MTLRHAQYLWVASSVAIPTIATLMSNTPYKYVIMVLSILHLINLFRVTSNAFQRAIQDATVRMGQSVRTSYPHAVPFGDESEHRRTGRGQAR